jgi:hypothetical protein
MAMRRLLLVEFPGVDSHVASRGHVSGLNHRDVRVCAQHPTAIVHAMERFDAQVLESGVRNCG